MTDDDFQILLKEVASLREKTTTSPYGPVPASVTHLESVLAGPLSVEDRADVYSLLVNECSKARNESLYIDILRRRVRDLPYDPMSHAGLAFRLAIVGAGCRDESLSVARKALALAKEQDRQVRYCSTTLARIALMLDDYGALHDSLAELVADSGRFRLEDTAYEFDFVDQIDARRVDAALLKAYMGLESS